MTGNRWLSVCALLCWLPLAGCGDEDHVNIFHATFSADGVGKDFRTQAGFTLCPQTYCISYFLNDQNQTMNGLFLYVPTDVHAGARYTQASEHFFAIYIDTAGKYFDTRYTGAAFELTVRDWGGVGQYAHGSFAGTIRDEFDTAGVAIASGAFEGFIHQ